jgi:CheY-like chemotaxis protein
MEKYTSASHPLVDEAPANDAASNERPPYVRKASGVQRIALPRPVDDDKPQPTFRNEAPGAKTVLVVEDDDHIRKLLVHSLATQYTVYEAKDGIEALQILRQIDPPHAMTCDVGMPRLDGYELARRVKNDPRLRFMSIVFITARAGAMDVVQGINCGARAYVPKPFQLAQLLDKVARAVK